MAVARIKQLLSTIQANPANKEGYTNLRTLIRELKDLAMWMENPESIGIDKGNFECMAEILDAVALVLIDELRGENKIAEWQHNTVLYIGTVMAASGITLYRELVKRED